MQNKKRGFSLFQPKERMAFLLLFLVQMSGLFVFFSESAQAATLLQGTWKKVCSDWSCSAGTSLKSICESDPKRKTVSCSAVAGKTCEGYWYPGDTEIGAEYCGTCCNPNGGTEQCSDSYVCIPNNTSSGGGTTSGTCGTANGATLTCGDLMSCLGGKTICASGTSSPISGTEPSGANALALHNPTTSSTWVGWDWTCGGSSKCLACLPGYVQSGGTCVPQGQTGGGTTSGTCGTANGATLTCGDLMSCLGGKTICASGTSSPISGTEPSGANALALHNPTTSSTWVGWDWTCGGSSKCLACLPGYVQSGGTCVPQNSTTGTGNDGAASCTVSAVPEGNNQYRVSYSINWGNATYTSVSLAGGGGLSQTIQKTSTTQSGSALASSSGGSMTFKITPLTGFSPGPGPLCSVTVNSGTETGGTIQIPGYCGNAATNYTNDQTQYSGSFCYTGIQEPLNPAFPPQNGSSQWTCKGLTGGTDSSTCTATRNSTLPQTCSTYTASTTIPDGYGSPFNQLSGSKESLLSIACSSTANGATANAGSTQSDTYTYKTGFVSQNGTWSKIDFSGNPDSNNAGWFKGVATASLPAASSSQNFVAAFICQYDGGKWKCGCRDSACSQNYWTLQAYQR